MTEPVTAELGTGEPEAAGGRRSRADRASGGAAARRAARSGGGPGIQQTYIKRAIKVYEVLDLSLIHISEPTRPY